VPPLVFASAINIDLRLLIRSLLPNLMLLPGTAAINGDHRFNFESIDPDFATSVALRALISATDPVAVIAISGCPEKLIFWSRESFVQ